VKHTASIYRQTLKVRAGGTSDALFTILHGITSRKNVMFKRNENKIRTKKLGMRGGWPPTANAKRPTKKTGILHIITQRYGKGMHNGTPEDNMKL